MLSDIHFSKRYYDLYEKTKSDLSIDVDPDTKALGLELIGLSVERNTKESFFKYRENADQLNNGIEELALTGIS